MARYLILSGLSKTGSTTIKALAALGVAPENIVAGTRDPSRTESDIKALGAGHVVALDPENDESIQKALVGIDAVLVSLGGHHRLVPVYTRIERIAAQPGSSVKSIVAIGAILNGEGAVAKDFAAASKVILDSKLASAVVAPNWFFENWKLPSLSGQLQAGTVYGSSSDGKVAYIAAQDIGNVVAKVLLDTQKYNGKLIEISGPEALTEAQFAAIISKEKFGKEATFVNIPEEAFKQAIAAALPADWVDYLYELEVIKASGHAGTVTSAVQDITGKAPLSVHQWIKDYFQS